MFVIQNGCTLWTDLKERMKGECLNHIKNAKFEREGVEFIQPLIMALIEGSQMKALSEGPCVPLIDSLQRVMGNNSSDKQYVYTAAAANCCLVCNDLQDVVNRRDRIRDAVRDAARDKSCSGKRNVKNFKVLTVEQAAKALELIPTK